MMALLLPYAPPGLSHIAGWCLSGAPLRGQPWPPAMMLPHRCKGLRVRRNDGGVDVPQALHGVPVPRQLLRNESARFYHHRTRKCIPPRKLRL